MKRLILGLLFVGSLLGQNTGANVTMLTAVSARTQTVSTTYTCDTRTCATSPGALKIQNIGQSNHSATINVTVNGAAANVLNVSCFIQASVDGGTNWFNIGPAVSGTQPSGIFQQRCFGYGSFPDIRVTAIVTGSTVPFPTTLNVVYIGNSIPSNSLNDLTGVSTAMVSSSVDTLVTGGVSTALFIVSAPLSVSIYGLEILSDGTGTKLGLTCTGSGALINFYIKTSAPIVFPPGMRALLSCKPGENINYILAGTPVTSLTVMWRTE